MHVITNKPCFGCDRVIDGPVVSDVYRCSGCSTPYGIWFVHAFDAAEWARIHRDRLACWPCGTDEFPVVHLSTTGRAIGCVLHAAENVS